MKETVDIQNHDLDELFEKYRQSPDSYVFVLLADACRKIERLDEALEICTEGVARHPRYASGYVVKGKCHYDQGDKDQAREAFEEVLSLDPNNLVALKFLGMIEAEAGRFDEARDHFQHILNLDPENKDIMRTLSDVDEREQLQEQTDSNDTHAAGDWTDISHNELDVSATEPIPQAVGVESSDELATVTLADIFASQGYKDKARKIYEELLKKKPESLLVTNKLRALEGKEPIAANTVATEAPTTTEAEDITKAKTVELEIVPTSLKKEKVDDATLDETDVDLSPPDHTTVDLPGSDDSSEDEAPSVDTDGGAPPDHTAVDLSESDETSVELSPPVDTDGDSPDQTAVDLPDSDDADAMMAPLDDDGDTVDVVQDDVASSVIELPGPADDEEDRTESAEQPSSAKTRDAEESQAGGLSEIAEKSAPSGDESRPKRPKKVRPRGARTAKPAAEPPASRRRSIDEQDTLNHFKRWLNRMAD